MCLGSSPWCYLFEVWSLDLDVFASPAQQVFQPLFFQISFLTFSLAFPSETFYNMEYISIGCYLRDPWEIFTFKIFHFTPFSGDAHVFLPAHWSFLYFNPIRCWIPEVYFSVSYNCWLVLIFFIFFGEDFTVFTHFTSLSLRNIFMTVTLNFIRLIALFPVSSGILFRVYLYWFWNMFLCLFFSPTLCLSKCVRWNSCLSQS